MDKSIRRLFISIIITFILVFASIPLWNYSSGKKGAILAETYKDLTVSVEIGKFPQMIIIEDARAFKYIEPTNISLRNKNDESKECELLMLVDKKSTINYEYLRVSIGDKIYKLTDLVKIEDKDNYYFILEKYNIEPYKDIKLKVRIWISENVKDIDENSSLITNFITR